MRTRTIVAANWVLVALILWVWATNASIPLRIVQTISYVVYEWTGVTLPFYPDL